MARGRARLRKKWEKQQSRAPRPVIRGAAVVRIESATSPDDLAAKAIDSALEPDVVAAPPAATAWPDLERRRKPRLPAFRRHNAPVEWKHVAIYIPLLLLVIVLGAYAIWSFLERQSMVPEVVTLPPVTVVTASANSRFAAAWVRLLNEAELQSTLVTADRVEALQGVVVLCDIWSLPPRLASSLDRFLAAGGSVVIIGPPPVTPVGGLHLTADTGLSDNAVKFSESASPLLARLTPGGLVSLRPTKVAFLKETSRMAIDARWQKNSRAAVMHIVNGRARVVWIGIDADALPPAGDNQFALLVRTAFRWAGGEAISDGAVGPAPEVRAFTPQARREARQAGFAFGVDPLRGQRAFSVRMVDHGAAPLENPTVKVWLPPGVRQVALGGDLQMRRNVTVTSIPDDAACLVSLPSLGRNEERVTKLTVTESR